jgi:hypothetical protein
MPSSLRSLEKEKDVEDVQGVHDPTHDPDAEFGGTEERKRIEKKLLWKIDARMSIMILIYILNYVSAFRRSLRDFSNAYGID